MMGLPVNPRPIQYLPGESPRMYVYSGNETVYQGSGYYSSEDAWFTIDSLAGKTWDTETGVGLPEFAAAEQCRFYVDWRIPYGDSPDNSFQGDSVVFDIEYILTQVAAS